MRARLLCTIFLFVFLFSGCTKTTPVTVTPSAPARTLIPTNTLTAAPTIEATPSLTLAATPAQTDWWKDAVFYEIYVRSFYDSDGDGTGDFKGITQKLDYLNDGNPQTTTDLGVTALWLIPIMPSPSVHGYDVTDYYAVNPQYGTMDDFKKLLNQVHQRGMHLILDLPQNHTSSEHPWFIASMDPTSPYRDWYIWSETNPGFLGPWNRVVWHPLNGEFFYGYFWEGMPDLNYTNPDVTAEMQAISRFWLNDVGVDGFRLDAIGALIEEGQVVTDTASTHQWLRDYHKFTKDINPIAFTVGEVWMPNETVVTYVKDDDIDLAFNFDLASAIIQGINEHNPRIFEDQVIKARDMFPEGRYGVFVTNHDMDRIMTQLGNDPQKARVAASIYLTLPGVPFIFYGEEVGMGGTPQADHIRYPMQWSGELNAGFTTGTPWLPPLTSYSTYNVESEQDNPDSLLNHYKKLIAIRNSNLTIRQGKVYENSVSSPGLYSTLVVMDKEAVLVVVNLSANAIGSINLSLPYSRLRAGDYQIKDIFGTASDSHVSVNDKGGFANLQLGTSIPAYGTLIYQLTP